jgi:hypothetical protein
MSWKTNEHGLIEGHEPDNLLAYDNEPEFCRDFTEEQYRLLYKMLDPEYVQSYSSAQRRMTPLIAGSLSEFNFDPVQTKEALRQVPYYASRLGYVEMKRQQTLIQQVADEDLPLFIDIKGEDQEDTKVLRTILEWRFKCQLK